MKPEALGLTLDDDLRPLWDEIEKKADAELWRIAKAGEAWSTDLDGYVDAQMLLVDKQLRRNMWRVIGNGVLVLIGLGCIAFLAMRILA